MKKKFVVAFSMILLMNLGSVALVSSHAAFVLVDDFDGLVNGDIDGQDGWSSTNFSGSSSGTFDVVDAAPATLSDKALTNNAASVSTSHALSPVDASSTGTLFFSVYLTDLTTGTSIGLTDNPATPSFNSYRSQIAFNVGISVRDGGSGATVDNVTISTGTWYDFWIVADNSADTWEAYVQGGAITTQTKLSVAGDSVFDFRTTGGSIDGFMIARGTNGSTNTLFLDNVYFDSTGVNLANPIPEASAFSLFGICTLSLLFHRVRRKMKETLN